MKDKDLEKAAEEILLQNMVDVNFLKKECQFNEVINAMKDMHILSKQEQPKTEK